ncbi:MAG: hypothetical protein KC503_02870 [Myxococcales bacterium]|nr:hypothetical protein [Myxococcales bacterium]
MRYAPATFSVCPTCIRSYPIDPRLADDAKRGHSKCRGCPHCSVDSTVGSASRARRDTARVPTLHVDQTQRIPVAPVREEQAASAAAAKVGFNGRAFALGAAVSLALIVPAAWLWLL